MIYFIFKNLNNLYNPWKKEQFDVVSMRIIFSNHHRYLIVQETKWENSHVISEYVKILHHSLYLREITFWHYNFHYSRCCYSRSNCWLVWRTSTGEIGNSGRLFLVKFWWFELWTNPQKRDLIWIFKTRKKRTKQKNAINKFCFCFFIFK